jgi:hypothetical protein
LAEAGYWDLKNRNEEIPSRRRAACDSSCSWSRQQMAMATMLLLRLTFLVLVIIITVMKGGTDLY